jgi:antitoxin (DNA-binding transcriptional repressor) of toxin-antitoxin stability system
MRTVDIGEVNGTLTKLLRESVDGPIVLTERGTPVALLINVRNADLETISLSMNPQFLRILEQSRQSLREEGGVPLDEALQYLESLPNETVS